MQDELETEPPEGPSAEDVRRLRDVLRVMSDDDQAILVPYFAYGFDAAEIAKVAGVSKFSVYKRIDTALKRTRSKLGINIPFKPVRLKDFEFSNPKEIQ